jgi:hypothetical protein
MSNGGGIMRWFGFGLVADLQGSEATPNRFIFWREMNLRLVSRLRHHLGPRRGQQDDNFLQRTHFLLTPR